MPHHQGHSLLAWSWPIVTVSAYPQPHSNEAWWAKVPEALAPFTDSDHARELEKRCVRMGVESDPAPFTLALNPFMALEFRSKESLPDILIVRLSKLAPWGVTRQFQELADHALFLANRLTVNLGGQLYLESSQPDGVIFLGRSLGTHARVSMTRHADECYTVRIDVKHLAQVAFFPGSNISVHGARPPWMEPTPHRNPHVIMAINEVVLFTNGHVVTVEHDKECRDRFGTLSSVYNSPANNF